MSVDIESDYKVDPETRKLVYEHVKDAPDLLIQDGNDLDTKGVALLAAASVVLGLASFAKLTGGASAAPALVALAVAGLGFLFAVYHAALLLGPTTYVRSSSCR